MGNFIHRDPMGCSVSLADRKLILDLVRRAIASEKARREEDPSEEGSSA